MRIVFVRRERGFYARILAYTHELNATHLPSVGGLFSVFVPAAFLFVTCSFRSTLC